MRQKLAIEKAKDKSEAITDVPVAEVILEQIAEKEIGKEHIAEQTAKTVHIPERRVKGLKVVGKMDLGETVKVVDKQIPPSDGESKEKTQPAGEVVKKKKKPKARKKPSDAPVEEIPESKKRKRVKRFEIDQKEVKDAIRKTLLSMDDTATSARASSRKRKKKEREEAEERRVEEKEKGKSKLTVTEFIAVNELANLMGVQVSEVIAKCIGLGLMVSINQRLDVETITLVADEFGFQVEFEKEYTSEALEDTEDYEDELKPRPPVVTIMGHVDHGKTSLLDYIRRTNVVAGESGGITQHIGAYKVDVGKGKYIAFLDTPGHEAFTAMRARGAQVTDIVVLVVAADDAVMPQTVEAINHAQAARVPIVIAINKVDKPGANIDKIKQQLADRNVLVEEWGGKYQCIEISAKTGLNVTNLLDLILLEADVLDLKANPDRLARGAVVEAELDKGRGITGTILVQKGTLKIGDPFVAGIYFGKVKAMFGERGNKLFEAPPSTPVQVLGFEGAPQAGDTFVVVESEREAREISLKRQQLRREQDQKQIHHITLDEIAKQISIGGVKELALIVKGDVDGSVEALSDSLMKLTNEEVVVRVIHKGVGGISESDVLLASASAAIIIGFHVRPNLNARKLAETNKVDIRLYNIIYDAINEVKSALEGLLSPVLSEEITSTVEVRDIFKVPKFGTVAGCYVREGKIARNNKIRLIRDGIIIHEGDITSLKRFKDDARDVDAGYECGISLANYNDIIIGDIIEGFKIIETKKKLA
ncbi:MAG: translation initiation factor IF-2 [Ignavibacteriales bacterium]|nr:translation initiation factor IF-2 [Ignavibacteriales bacterium]